MDACRIVGDDGVLSAALHAEVCDGVISGVACVVPELILAVYSGESIGRTRPRERWTNLLNSSARFLRRGG